MYYKRKLILYNLCVHESKSLDGHCLLWNEIDGGRGSNIIGTALYLYLTLLPSTVKEVLLTSDSHGGQNRNQYVAAMLLFVVTTTQLQKITVNFYEPGHTHMECDSMHSAIETSKQTKKLFSMKDWEDVIINARTRDKNLKRHPYQYHRLTFESFYNLKGVNVIKNRAVNTNGEKVNWMKIKSLEFCKDENHLNFYKNDPTEEFKIIDIRGSRISRRNIHMKDSQFPTRLSKLYMNPIPITRRSMMN